MGIQLQGSAGAIFGPTGANHSQGLVPDPGTVAHSPPYYLGDDANFHAVTSGLIPGQLPGTTTNDNATAGDVGEYTISNYVTGISLSNGVTSNITSLPLTAGDWDVSGVWGFSVASGGTAPLMVGLTSLTSASGTPIETGVFSQLAASITPQFLNQLALPATRVSLAAPATVYLNIGAAITGTASGQGLLRARRMR